MILSCVHSGETADRCPLWLGAGGLRAGRAALEAELLYCLRPALMERLLFDGWSWQPCCLLNSHLQGTKESLLYIL